MRYLLLLHADEEAFARLPEDEQATAMAGYGAFGQALSEAGALVANGRLADVDQARTVRTKGGRVVVMDGPFAETKEQIGGFYLIEAESLEAALAWAGRCPTSRHGVVEVRPLWT